MVLNINKNILQFYKIKNDHNQMLYIIFQNTHVTIAPNVIKNNATY
jgi:hypothetical protein